MKVHTTAFKEQIKEMGRELDSIITFGDTVLGVEELNAVTPSFESSILKSVMKQLEIDSNVEIPQGTILNYKFGIKADGNFEYLDFGNYIVKEVEKQEDTNSYKITCYDKMLYSMVDYVDIGVTYPITIREYINAICEHLGLVFKNRENEFANFDKIIPNEMYLTEDGRSVDYTFRDVFDELSQVTASNICINDDDEVEIRYLNNTGDTVDEEYLKDINVNFGQKFGAVNTIVLSRSVESDNIYYPEELSENPVEIKIKDNQIMNFNDRADYLPDIYEKLNGLEFYTNDFNSTGICYYDFGDKYNVKIGDNIYPCIMFNDEILVTQGLEENIFTEMPEETETDYKKADKDDRKMNQVYLIVNKQEGTINAVVNEQSNQSAKLSQLEINSGMISEQVSSMQTTVDETSGQVIELENTVSQTITSTSAQFETINKTLTDGVEKVVNDLVTIDNRGVVVSTSEDEFEAILSNKSVEIADGLKEIAFFGYDEELQKTIARIEELETRKLTSGNHRCEPFRDEETFENRSGWFYVGGVR